jgi:hypothetical protein
MVDYAQPLPSTTTAASTRKPPAPPKTCNKMRFGPHVPDGLKCGNPATHLFAVVITGGNRRRGPLSLFTLPDGTLKPEVGWLGWCARCPECMRDELEERANG